MQKPATEAEESLGMHQRVDLSFRFAALFAAAVLHFATPGVGVAQPEVADSRFERIAEVVTEKMKEYGIPGVALGIDFESHVQTRGFAFSLSEILSLLGKTAARGV